MNNVEATTVFKNGPWWNETCDLTIDEEFPRPRFVLGRRLRHKTSRRRLMRTIQWFAPHDEPNQDNAMTKFVVKIEE